MTVNWDYTISARGGQTPRKDKIVASASDWVLTVKADGERADMARVLAVLADKMFKTSAKVAIRISVLSEDKASLESSILQMAPEIARLAGQPTLDIFPFEETNELRTEKALEA